MYNMLSHGVAIWIVTADTELGVWLGSVQAALRRINVKGPTSVWIESK